MSSSKIANSNWMIVETNLLTLIFNNFLPLLSSPIIPCSFNNSEDCSFLVFESSELLAWISFAKCLNTRLLVASSSFYLKYWYSWSSLPLCCSIFLLSSASCSCNIYLSLSWSPFSINALALSLLWVVFCAELITDPEWF